MLGLQKKGLRPIISHCEERSNQRVNPEVSGVKGY